MSKKQLVYVAQHVSTTFLLSFLLVEQSGLAVKPALLAATIVALRDLKSLFDNIYDVGISDKGVNVDDEMKRGPGRPKKDTTTP